MLARAGDLEAKASIKKCVRVYVYIYIYLYIHLYTYIYIHLFIYTYIFTYTNTCIVYVHTSMYADKKLGCNHTLLLAQYVLVSR